MAFGRAVGAIALFSKGAVASIGAPSAPSIVHHRANVRLLSPFANQQ